MNAAQAWAPGNISLVFGVVPHTLAQKTGSVGIGFTINEGATVTVQRARKHTISYNGIQLNLPCVTQTIHQLTKIPLAVSIDSPLPLGSGFGMSAASALAAAYAVNELLDLQKHPLTLAKAAHTAEVLSKTGLGDVANEYFGGFFAKFVTSARFTVQKLPIPPISVYCISYGKLLTSSVLGDSRLVSTINTNANIALETLAKLLARQETLSFDVIASLANTFTRACGLMTPEISRTITAIEKRGGVAAMILLGNAVVSTIPFDDAIALRMDSKKATLL